MTIDRIGKLFTDRYGIKSELYSVKSNSNNFFCTEEQMIFPRQVWSMIIEHYNPSSKDIINAYNIFNIEDNGDRLESTFEFKQSRRFCLSNTPEGNEFLYGHIYKKAIEPSLGYFGINSIHNSSDNTRWYKSHRCISFIEILLEVLENNQKYDEQLIQLIRQRINQQLRNHNILFSYNNGKFQKTDDHAISKEIDSEFWRFVNKPECKIIESSMKMAIDCRDSGIGNSIAEMAKALEATAKFVLENNNISSMAQGPSHLINKLRENKIISSYITKQLLAFFKEIRNVAVHPSSSDNSLIDLMDIKEINMHLRFCMIMCKYLLEL